MSIINTNPALNIRKDLSISFPVADGQGWFVHIKAFLTIVLGANAA